MRVGMAQRRQGRRHNGQSLDGVRRRFLERETGIEPATNGLGSRYSTIELLPPGSELIIAGVTLWSEGMAGCGDVLPLREYGSG